MISIAPAFYPCRERFGTAGKIVNKVHLVRAFVVPPRPVKKKWTHIVSNHLFSPPTHRVSACKAFPFFQIFRHSFLPSVLSFFLSSFLRFFQTSCPPGGRFTSPLTPLLANRPLHYLATGPPRNLLFSIPIFASISAASSRCRAFLTISDTRIKILNQTTRLSPSSLQNGPRLQWAATVSVLRFASFFRVIFCTLFFRTFCKFVIDFACLFRYLFEQAFGLLAFQFFLVCIPWVKVTAA